MEFNHYKTREITTSLNKGSILGIKALKRSGIIVLFGLSSLFLVFYSFLEPFWSFLSILLEIYRESEFKSLNPSGIIMLFGLSSLLLMFYSYLEPFLVFFYQFYLRFREYLMSRPLDHPRILVFFGLSLLFLVFHSFFVLSIVFDSFYLSLT